MRQPMLLGGVLLLALSGSAGCGGDSTGPGASTFKIKSPAISIDAGADTTLCIFVHTPNAAQAAIKSLQVTLPAGVVSAALLFTATDAQPVGTVSAANCGPLDAGGQVATLVFESRGSMTRLDFPSNDGNGAPVAAIVPAAQPAYLRIRYLNAGGSPITPQVTFTAATYPAGTSVVRADPFVTYNSNISIPPNSIGTATDTCDTPAGSHFFQLTLFTNSRGTAFSVADGNSTLFSGNDWNDPGNSVALTSPFLDFTTAKMSYTCTYLNTGNSVVQSGSSSKSDETCIAAGWYFPSIAPQFCFDGVVTSALALGDQRQGGTPPASNQ